MKDLKQIRTAISKLRIVDLNTNEAYGEIQKIIANDIGQVALPSKIFEPGLKLHRCRNRNGELFKDATEISYREDLESITDYGRVNESNQSIFYAADVRPTAISETSKAFRGENYKDIDEISITTGHWESIDNLKMALIVGNAHAQEKNELTKMYATDILEFTKQTFPEEHDKVIELLNFLADEFSINTQGDQNKYKISCAFAQLAFESSDGIVYPSLQRNFEGLNFALKPEVVDKKLRLTTATNDKFKKEGEKSYQHFETQEGTADDKGVIVWGEIQKIEKQ